MFRRIAIIGNAGGGKTTVSRKLGDFYKVPVTHVDSIQYGEGWTYIPEEICSQLLNKIADGDSWLIDGFGNRSVLERRLRNADTVVFIDFPLYRHYWWATKRQLGSWRGSRSELQPGCSEFSFKFTKNLAQIIWELNRDYVPWFRKLASELPKSTRLFHLRSPDDVEIFLEKLSID